LFFLLKCGKVLLCVLITGRDVEIPLPRTFMVFANWVVQLRDWARE
jgi:hypothetical protein